MRKSSETGICFLFCATTIGPIGSADAKAKIDFRTATKIAEMEKLGGKIRDGATVQTTLSGKTLKGKEWSWTFNADGTESSKDNKIAFAEDRYWPRLCKNEYLDDATNGLIGW